MQRFPGSAQPGCVQHTAWLSTALLMWGAMSASPIQHPTSNSDRSFLWLLGKSGTLIPVLFEIFFWTLPDGNNWSANMNMNHLKVLATAQSNLKPVVGWSPQFNKQDQTQIREYYTTFKWLILWSGCSGLTVIKIMQVKSAFLKHTNLLETIHNRR